MHIEPPTIPDGRTLFFQIMVPIEPDLANIPNLAPEDAEAIFSRDPAETEEAFAERNARYDRAFAEYDRQYAAYMRAKEQEVQSYAVQLEQDMRAKESHSIESGLLAV